MNTSPQIYDTRDDEFSDDPGDIVNRCPAILPKKGGVGTIYCSGPLTTIDRTEDADKHFAPGMAYACARCGKAWREGDIYPPPDRRDE